MKYCYLLPTLFLNRVEIFGEKYFLFIFYFMLSVAFGHSYVFQIKLDEHDLSKLVRIIYILKQKQSAKRKHCNVVVFIFLEISFNNPMG